METREWRFIDKSGWPEGPWTTEPDKVQFTDSATGLPCLVRRHARAGFWCGYVGVPEALTDRIDTDALEVHGGVTYGPARCDGDEETGICHLAGPGDFEPAFWIGFDCAHIDDLQPGNLTWDRAHGFVRPDDRYRDIDYARAQCAKLAAQIQVATSAPEQT